MMELRMLCCRLFPPTLHFHPWSGVLQQIRSAHSKPFFVTTPIFYVNAAPHIGHLYSCLLADVSVRWQRLKGQSTLLTTGTDEHGLKIQQAAASSNLDPQVFCDNISHKFQSLFDAVGIKYDRFIRTTDPEHKEAVCTFWRKLLKEEHIYKGTYTGWYSVSDEAFLSDSDIVSKTLPDGSTVQVSKESGHPVSWTEENNYMFRLSNFQQDILHWLNSSPIHPVKFEQPVRQAVQNLSDLSVTRCRDRLPWGIAVPDDDSQTIYVWLDALINYLTVVNYPRATAEAWPPDCQIIGKDILKFHAVYWPAFLIAAGLEPPRKLVVHSHWLVDSVKMSKSLGNVIDPLEKILVFGVDGLRYFLLKEGSLDSDGTYTDKRMMERINSDLANTLGNLLGRCTAPSVNKQQQLPPLVEDNLYEHFSPEERDVHKILYTLPDEVDHLFQDLCFTKGLDLIMSRLHWANSLVQLHAPWQLSKSCDPQDTAHLLTVLHVAMETLRVCGILLQPAVPELSDRHLEDVMLVPVFSLIYQIIRERYCQRYVWQPLLPQLQAAPDGYFYNQVARLLSRLGVPTQERKFSDAKQPLVHGYQTLGERIVLQKKVNVSS